MYKMLVSDFYNALIDYEEAIPLSTMIEIDKIRQNGILFSVVTGKSPMLINDYNKDFPFIDFIIGFNGNYIYDVVNKKVLYDKVLGISIVKKIYKTFMDKNICFYTLDCCNYIGNYKDIDCSEEISDFNSFFEVNKQRIYKIKICVETLKDAKKIVDVIIAFQLKVNTYINVFDDKYFVEIYSCVSDKLLGVQKICKLNKINISEVVGIGVSEESYVLIKNVGYGVCLLNACDSLKKISRFVGLSNNDKGVEQIIKKIF